ncbi:MAG TPA: PAS domain S-box protein [Bacteroidota bacterium]|nr:PAS domain S-box protein [Bacteroidota bacterium]
MSGDATSIALETIEHLGVHEHLALLYSSEREQFDILTPFFRAGFERNDQCFYLVDDVTPTSILNRLRSEGLDVDGALGARALVIECRRRGYFDPEYTIRHLKEAAEAAIADGFTAFRFVSDMSWILAREGGIDRLNEFESMLNYFFPQYPALGICQYNLKRFKPDTIKEIILVHPNVIVGGSIRKNPMEDSNVRLNLVITDHQRTEERLRQSETRLAEAQRLAHMGSYGLDVRTGETEWSDETFRMLGLDPSVSKASIDGLIRAVHPEDKVRVERAIVTALKEKSPFELEFRIAVGHSLKYILGLGQVALNDAGDVVRLYGTLMDITERRRLQDALQAGEERYRRLLSSVTDYVYSVAIAEGRAVSTSHGAGCIAVTGYTPEDHVADPFLWYSMVYPDDRVLVTEEAEHRMRGEWTKPLEHRIIHKNGSIRWVRNTIVPRRDQNGRLIGYDGLVEDITERKEMEDAVLNSVAHYRAMINAFEGMVVVCTSDYRIDFMNLQFINRIGRDARGEDYRALMEEKKGTCPGCIDERAFKGEVVHWEVQCPADGRWFNVTNTPIKTADGSIAVLATVEDITETKHHEKVLEESRQRYLDIVDSVYDWIWEVDARGVYTFSSLRVRELLGFEPNEVVGKSIVDFLMPFEIERISSIFQDSVSARKPIVALENICKHRDGHPVVVETSGKPFYDAGGNLLGYRGVDRDITERRKGKPEEKVSPLQ